MKKLSLSKLERFYKEERKRLNPAYKWNKLDCIYVGNLYRKLVQEYGEQSTVVLSG